ncbi:MAG: response regulator transcription factor [Actinobacteria bacterium]|nr:response regulator transcription factor [Actinomycetota bacterium]
MSVEVVLVDDQAMVRSGLRSLLEGDGIAVVAEASDGEEAVAAVLRHRPDVVLMDIRMPVLDGIAATRRLVAAGSSARVLVLTTFDLDEYVFEALRAGASGFLLKDATAEELSDAVRTLAEGNGLLAGAVARRVIEEFARLPTPRAPVEHVADLTARETEVLRLLAQGCSNAEIARALVVSNATAKTHVSNVLAKLRLRDRIQAVIYAYESGLVRPSG